MDHEYVDTNGTKLSFPAPTVSGGFTHDIDYLDLDQDDIFKIHDLKQNNKYLFVLTEDY